MKFTTQDIEKLKSILAVCKVLGIEGIVFNEGLARGAKPSLDAAIITPAEFSFSDVSIGIGRVTELDKRLAIFPADVVIEGKCNDKGDATILTLQSGKMKMQFRCTSSNMIKYPKSNDDVPACTIKMARAEAQQIVKAAKTLGAESIVVSVSRSGVAKIECSDSSNDKFEIELSNPVKYEGSEDSFVQSYLAGLFSDVIDSAAKEVEEIDLIVGEVCSVTTTLKGHLVMIMSQITGDE